MSNARMDVLLELKREVHDAAVYPHGAGISPYISIKVFDAILQKKINECREVKADE